MYATHHLNSTVSTNIIARNLADSGAGHGAAVIASYQTAGRGRLGKSWHSVAGKGLYCSIIVRPKLDVVDYPKITLAAGLSVSFVLDRLTGKASQLKWPNDIYYNGRKCGGILTESSSMNSGRGERYAVVGIGVNVNNTRSDFPMDLQADTTSLFNETQCTYSISEVFESVRNELIRMLDLFCRKGFSPILALWRERDFLLGKKMTCVSVDKCIVEGISLGPDAEGVLHVRDPEGVIHRVLSGDVRLARVK